MIISRYVFVEQAFILVGIFIIDVEINNICCCEIKLVYFEETWWLFDFITLYLLHQEFLIMRNVFSKTFQTIVKLWR